ncbi:MAG: amidohydrolase family protein [Pseudomonadota bacterium]
MAFDLIIRNARLEDDGLPVDIGIRDGKIHSIGDVKGDGSEVRHINARNNLVMPGFVNSHTHLDKADLLSQMKPFQFGGTLEQNRKLIREFKENYTIAGIKERAGRVVKEMVRHGITAIRTQVDVDPTAKLLPVIAISELRKEYIDTVHIEICAFPQEGVLKPGAVELLEQALGSGADLLGGLPLVEKSEIEQKKHIDILFEMAKKFGVDLEVQLDESNDPKDFMLPYLAEKTIKEGYQGKVSATHCISLSKVDDEIASEVIKKLKEAEINVIVTPSCNLITRFPELKASRPYNSITRVPQLVEDGVNVAMGTDNVRDIFYPLGNGSMIREMHVLATTTRMTRIEDVDHIFDIGSLNGAKILGLDYGVSVGRSADLVVANSTTKRGVISGQEAIPYIVKNGHVISQSELIIQEFPF